MPANGFGVALKTLRERRTLSGRELSTLAELDHAYENRLETGDKTNPSHEVLDKLVRALKPSERDGRILRWLAQHPNTDPALVLHALDDRSVTMDEFTMAAGAVHRGSRPDPATLIERVRRVMREE
jgi:transcriptional regulator with XRE-family HTH domain